MTCATSEDSDQPMHRRSQSLRCTDAQVYLSSMYAHSQGTFSCIASYSGADSEGGFMGRGGGGGEVSVEPPLIQFHLNTFDKFGTLYRI